MPRITVAVPVYNRDASLRRALTSLQRQTFADFECIVVDDASTMPIKPIVDELEDERFRYVRTDRNGGPYNARRHAYRQMRGEYLTGLDSDDEAFPWMLGQAVRYLDEVEEVDGVAGLYLRSSDGRLFVRISGGRKIMTPAEYAGTPPVPDCIGAVRRQVVDEWLTKRDDYFALEAHQWFTFHMHHSMLFVEEPWARNHVDSAERVSSGSDARLYDDYVKFLDEHMEYARSTPSLVLDHILQTGWFVLWRAGRTDEAARFQEVLEQRGIARWRVVGDRAVAKALRRVPLRRTSVTVLD